MQDVHKLCFFLLFVSFLFGSIVRIAAVAASAVSDKKQNSDEPKLSKTALNVQNG